MNTVDVFARVLAIGPTNCPFMQSTVADAVVSTIGEAFEQVRASLFHAQPFALRQSAPREMSEQPVSIDSLVVVVAA